MVDQARDFSKEAAQWDENPVRVKLAQDVADAIRNEIVLTPDMDALDFGCGTGLLTLELRPSVRTVVGVDSAPGMLAVLDEKIKRLNLGNVRTKRVDIENGGTLDGRFRLIASSMTLHHIKDIEALLAAFHRVIEPGGFLCIADLDLEEGQFHESNEGVFHFGFDRRQLREILERVGFADTRDRTAATVTKPAHSGEMRSFPVFLVTAAKT